MGYPHINLSYFAEPPLIAGYRRLASAKMRIANDMDRYQLHVMTELAPALQGEPHGLCVGEEPLVTQGWLERLYVGRERNSTEERHG